MPWNYTRRFPRRTAPVLFVIGLLVLCGVHPISAVTQSVVGIAGVPSAERDLLKVGKTAYWAAFSPSAALTADWLGVEVASVQFLFIDPGPGGEHALHDGDATRLPVGTPIYTLAGYHPEFRLVARAPDGSIVLYQAAISETAQSGVDLLDIRDRVQAIRVSELSVRTGSRQRMGTITNPATIGAVVQVFLDAPVVGATSNHPGPVLVLDEVTFELGDGTSVSYAYWPDNGLASFMFVPPISASGLSLPPMFAATVEDAFPK